MRKSIGKVLFLKFICSAFFLLVFSGKYLYAQSDTSLFQPTSYKLFLDFSDFNTYILHAHAQIVMKAKNNLARHASLSLLQLNVDSVLAGSTHLPYTYNDSVITIDFLKSVRVNDPQTITIYYHGQPGAQHSYFGGFYWNKTFAYNIGASFTASPHSFGRAWFPCTDNFAVRSNYEFFVTTPADKKAFCNGTLLDVNTADSVSTWHWKLDETIPAYLASVAVAGFQTITDTVHGINGIVPIQIAAVPDDTADAKKQFGHLKDAFHIFENHFGPYRWPRVGLCLVPFNEGAMEHATNIAFMRDYVHDENSNSMLVAAHELSHHWFGNLVTCKTEANIWLNEGWADYCESLYIEGLFGTDSARQYRNEKHTNEVLRCALADNGYLPLGNVPSKNIYGSTVYEKGGDVIQTLRYYMGDSLFFHCMQLYLAQYAYQAADIDDLERFLSNSSGMDLGNYFKDWIMQPGYPHFSIVSSQIKKVKEQYEVEVNIRQRRFHNSSLYNEVPVTISYIDKDLRRHDETVFISGEDNSYSTLLPFKPEMVELDMDGNLAQALTRETQLLRDTGIYEFNNALAAIAVNGIKNPALIRIEQNLVPLNALSKTYKGLHIDKARYYTVNGIIPPDLQATGAFEFGIASPDLNEANFIGSEDSLVLLYRPNQLADWKIISRQNIDKGSNSFDKSGFIIFTPVKAGDYAIAAYNYTLAPDTINMVVNKPLYTGGFKLLNPADKNLLTIEFEKNIFDRVEVADQHGHSYCTMHIAAKDKKASMDMGVCKEDPYFIILVTKSGERIIKKIN